MKIYAINMMILACPEVMPGHVKSIALVTLLASNGCQPPPVH